MWWAAFAVINWMGVAYLKERGPDVLKPAPLDNRLSALNFLILALTGMGLYGLVKFSMKWIKKLKV